MGLLFRAHPKAQPEGGFWRSPESNLRPLVYKASDLTTAPRTPPLHRPFEYRSEEFNSIYIDCEYLGFFTQRKCINILNSFIWHELHLISI